MAKLISLQRAQEMMQSEPRPTVIDTRTREAYAEGHLPGAVHISASELEAHLDEIPRDRPVITY